MPIGTNYYVSHAIIITNSLYLVNVIILVTRTPSIYNLSNNISTNYKV